MSVTLEERRREHAQADVRAVVAPRVVLLDLSVARNRVAFEIEGDTILALLATDPTATADVALVSPSNDPVTMFLGVRIRMLDGNRFRRFFVTNTAQVGKTLTLVVGGPEGVEVDAPGVVRVDVARTDVYSPGSFQWAAAEVSIGMASTSIYSMGPSTGGGVWRVRITNIGLQDIFLNQSTAFVASSYPLWPAGTFDQNVDVRSQAVMISGIVASGTGLVRYLFLPLG